MCDFVDEPLEIVNITRNLHTFLSFIDVLTIVKLMGKKLVNILRGGSSLASSGAGKPK